jgi:glycosyltransferase involved in cell wall biosynthesis
MTMPISAFVICHDEEAYIEACIRSLSMCAEIVVVDSGSKDQTLPILERLKNEGFPIVLLQEKWRGFGGQKQFALDQCTQDWCFSIDSDERVSLRLAADLPNLLTEAAVTGWKVTRYDYLLGYGFVPPASHERYHVRLFRRGSGSFDPSDIVHEGIRVEGEVRVAFNGGLLHFTSISIERQIEKWNRYSSLKAQMKADRNLKSKPIKIFVSPIVFFLRWYVRYGYWRCGWAGFIHCCEAAVYSFLTEAKRWENEAVLRHPPVEPDISKFDHY